MSYYYGGGNLKNGSKGYDVEQWQKYLTDQGYFTGEIDGIFGPVTEDATKRYQTDHGIYADGIFGTTTSAAAGFKNYNQAVDKPNAPTLWDKTTKGEEAKTAYGLAKDAVKGSDPFVFSENEWLDKLKGDIANYGEFNYNVNEDALYQQAVERYRDMGKMAMQDTMAQAAALTGGYGNSYASTAGNQAYQAYLQQAQDMLPEYYQMALQRYAMGKEDLYNQYGMLMKEYEREYGLHSDEYDRLLNELGIAKDDYYRGADLHNAEQGNILDNAWKEAEWDESMRRDAREEAAKYNQPTDEPLAEDEIITDPGASFSEDKYKLRLRENNGESYYDRTLEELAIKYKEGYTFDDLRAVVSDLYADSWLSPEEYGQLMRQLEAEERWASLASE